MNDQVVKFNDCVLEKLIKLELGIGKNNPVTISDMRKLKKLEMDGDTVCDLSGLEYAETIEKIIIISNGTLKNMELFGQLNNLTELELYEVGAEGISSLSNLKNLKKLCIMYNDELKSIDFIKDLTTLEELSIGYTRVDDISPLKKLSNIVELFIVDNKVYDYSTLKNMCGLEKLVIDVEKVDNIEFLSELHKLQSLRLYSHHKINDYSIISKMKYLKQLSLFYGSIKNPDFLKGLKLTKLMIVDNPIEDISTVFDLTELESLCLSEGNIKSIEGIQKLCNLDYLDLSDNSITDLRPIGNLNNLRSIIVDLPTNENGRPEVILPTPKGNKTKIDYNCIIGSIKMHLTDEEKELLVYFVSNPSKARAIECLNKSSRMLTFMYDYFTDEELLNLFKKVFIEEIAGEDYIRNFLYYEPFRYANVGIDEFEFIIDIASEEVRRKAKKIKLEQELA